MVENEELEEEELGDQDGEEVKRELEWLEFEGRFSSRPIQLYLILSNRG